MIQHILLLYVLPAILCILLGKYGPNIDDSKEVAVMISLIPVMNTLFVIAYLVIVIFKLILKKFMYWYNNE
jgi:hypothetical protein